MVAKIKTNETGDCIFSEQDAIDLLYTNPKFDITKLFFESTAQYNSAIKDLGLDLPNINTVPDRPNVKEWDQLNCECWNMPEKYYKINILQWLLDKCQTDEERLRVQTEYDLFEKKKFIKVLQFLIYFVDTLRTNNVVWGVGRGSSVASFCLFLIGVHKINPLLYNLDHTEFLR
jgi:DNA polymerase III alpha subunit|tara:strand:- start:1080 stop:1601 length:522 start_codon:yes stop_codon:yes gene_type:complete